jgi:hypothetical protein
MDVDVVEPYVIEVSVPSLAPGINVTVGESVLTMDVDAAPYMTAAVSVPAAPQVNVSSVAGETVLVVPTPGIPGIEGPTGASGDGAQVVGEIPLGEISGANTIFTTASPYVSGSVALYRNGLRQIGFYTESAPSTITVDDAPLIGDQISVDYLVD